MTDKYSNEDLPLFSPELPLTQIKEDENDDKRDSLEKIADISNEIFKKINEIKDSHTNSSESASSSLLLFYCISTISTFVFYLEASETFPFLFLRIITFGTLFLGFHFLLKLGNKSKDRFVFNVVAISSNFITSSVVLEAIGCFSTSNFSIFSLEKHSRLFVKDFQSIILSLALILMNNSIKPDLLDLITSLLIILFQIAFNRFFLSMFFPISCYLELLTWCILTITGIKLLKKQKSLRTVEKQKKLDSVGIETRKVLDILNQVQNSLQENYDQIAPETISKGDDLMRKLKFLKFQTLLNFNNQEKTQRRKSISGKIEASKGVFSSNKSKIKTPLSPRYKKNSRSFAKKNTSIIDAERAILLQKIEAYDYAPGAERIQKDKRWSLTPDDVDDIMNGILSKPSVFWLPNFLRTNNSRDIDVDSTNWVPKEAKDFLLSHFTENSGKFFADDMSVIKQNKFELDLKFLELNPLNDYLENVCENWNYDVFLLNTLTNGNVVIEFGYGIFRKFQVNKTLKIDNNSVISSFLYNVQVLYRNNPYHNSMHAADVTNSIGFFLTKGMNEVFSQFEGACLLISALAHDVGHPGLNNAFLMASKSKYAIIYNDTSVLENYHSSSLFQILVNSKSDITTNLTEKEFRSFRKLCIGMILDTDLQKHFNIMNKFKNLLGIGEFDINDETHRHLALSAALKCADIGHGAKGIELHKKWSRRIIEEFFSQGDLEIKHNMPVSPLCDRKGDVAKSQEGFLKCIVLPLFETFELFAQNEIITKHCSNQIKKNLEYWDSQKILEEKQKEGSFMEETKEVFNEICKMMSKNGEDSQSCISCT